MLISEVKGGQFSRQVRVKILAVTHGCSMTGKHLQWSVFFNKVLSVEPTRPTQVFPMSFSTIFRRAIL